MTEYIDTAEAARRLGVKRETLYAYVSRGLVTSQRASRTRGSRFDAAEIARLAERTRARGGRDPEQLDVVVSSALTLVDPEGRLYYRGVEVTDLLGSARFEEVAELLWSGRGVVDAPFDAPAELASAVGAVVAVADRAVLPAERMRLAVAAGSVLSSSRRSRDRSAEGVAAVGRRIVALEVLAAGGQAPHRATAGTGQAAGGLGQVATGPRQAPRPPAQPVQIADRLFQALAGRPGSPERVAAVDAALVLLADDPLATSTLAARLAASTWADPYLVVSAAMTATGGALHASNTGDRVADLLQEAAAAGPEQALEARRQRGEGVPGFGDSSFRGPDPRARALWDTVAGAWPESPLRRAAEEIVDRMAPAKATPDVPLGLLVAAAGMQAGAAEAVVTVARTAGWLAHAIEEYGHGQRFRPRMIYTGPMPGASPPRA